MKEILTIIIWTAYGIFLGFLFFNKKPKKKYYLIRYFRTGVVVHKNIVEMEYFYQTIKPEVKYTVRFNGVGTDIISDGFDISEIKP